MSAPWPEWRLPVHDHLRPKPETERWLSNVPAEVRSGAAGFFSTIADTVLIFGQVDRATHPKGWGYDFVGCMTLAEADRIVWEGQA